MQSLLLVEDDPKISSAISTLFGSQGWIVNVSSTIASLNDEILRPSRNYSVIVLDRLIHQYDTKDLLPEIRKTWPEVPVLIVSAINTPLERAELLNLGADDYLGKPYLQQELLARIKALSRRVKRAESNYREVGNTILDLDRFSFSVGERQEILTQKEFLLLKILTKNLGRVISREDLIAAVWGNDGDSESNVLEATITHLRRRLEGSLSNLKVKNIRYAGYFVET